MDWNKAKNTGVNACKGTCGVSLYVCVCVCVCVYACACAGLSFTVSLCGCTLPASFRPVMKCCLRILLLEYRLLVVCWPHDTWIWVWSFVCSFLRTGSGSHETRGICIQTNTNTFIWRVRIKYWAENVSLEYFCVYYSTLTDMEDK